MQKRALLYGTVIVVLLAIGMALLFSTQGAIQAYSAVGMVPTAIPSVPVPASRIPKLTHPTYNGGVPAVTHVGGGPVTVEDVRAFIAKYGFAASAHGKTTNGTMPTILQVTLMSAKQASALMNGAWPGRSDEAQVIYVELQGPFLIDMPVPSGFKVTPVQKAQELFDATTGDLIMFGST